MPLKLIPPKPGKTPFWYVRGTHLGVTLDRSTKLTVKATAGKLLKKWEAEIERGELSGAPVEAPETFLDGAVRYVKAGGDSNYIGYNEETGKWDPLIVKLGETPLAEIDQSKIDEVAADLYPNASAPTRNRQAYTPISAVLKHCGIEFKIRRPKGWRGSRRVNWLWPEQAFAVFAAADAIDPEFGIFERALCYTGIRLSEATDELLCDQMRLAESFAYLGDTKNGEPQPVFLPPPLVAALANHPRGLDRPGQRVFRFRKCGRLYQWHKQALKAAGVKLPPRSAGFHIWRHTYGTWMRRYGGLDSRELLETGRWKDQASASRYDHVVSTEISMRANLLPSEKRKA